MEMSYKTVGFIGLGVMGLPMATNLVNKLPKHISFMIFDLASDPVNQLCALDKSRVHACGSCREVAKKSVSDFVIDPIHVMEC